MGPTSEEARACNYVVSRVPPSPHLPPQHTLLSYFHGVTCVVSRLHKDGPVAQGSYKHSYRWIAQHVLGNARTEAHVENLLRHADVVRGRLVPKAGASSTT